MNFPRVLFYGMLAELLIVTVVLPDEGVTVTALQTITRFSGRLSLAIFSVIFLFHNKPGDLPVYLFKKPYHLLAWLHGVHLLELLAFIYLAEITLNPIRISGGFLAYIFIFLMPLIVQYHQTGKISSRTFRVTELVFLYYTWFIFFMTYLPRVQGKIQNAGGSYASHVILLGWVSTMLGIKITGLITRRPAIKR